MPRHGRSDPPVRLFAFTFGATMASVYALIRVHEVFLAMDMPTSELEFLVSRVVAKLSAFVAHPVGMIVTGAAMLASFLLMGKSVKASYQPQRKTSILCSLDMSSAGRSQWTV